MLFTHCQKRDFEAKNRSVLSKILIGFSENLLELGETGGDFRTRIFTAFSIQRGAESLENTAFSGFSHLPLSSVKFRQVRFWQLDSKSVCEQSHMGSNPILSANGTLENPVFSRALSIRRKFSDLDFLLFRCILSRFYALFLP